MKKRFVLFLFPILFISYTGTAFSKEMEGTIKSVDPATGTLVLTVGNKDVTITVEDKGSLKELTTGKTITLDVTEQDGKMSAKKAPKPAESRKTPDY
ncbi:MAG: hypothetical protein HY731_08600 [Candidatus Tectomicrobia bacterium]|nr:hypothetical protein [Candidatus Tectomicrobia bacterium]